MHRRDVLRSLMALPAARLAATQVAAAQAPAGEWTRSTAFKALQQQLGSRLVAVQSPLEACARAGGAGATELFAKLKNPYYLGDEPALTQSLGWHGAWTSQASRFAVRAESPADVAAAVTFARKERVRLVVKGGGHSYYGNSNAADSLLVWTRALDRIEVHDAFRCNGAPIGAATRQAVSVGAGAIWGHVYDVVAAKHGRYVQGGGCLTVGVSGFVLGGGFGSFSKAFGTGAANLLEAEIVTADGRVLIANPFSYADLFGALKGGGGGTFGVATRLTLATHPLPEMFGAVIFSVTASSDAAWSALVRRIIAFYAEALHNPTWGEQIRFDRGRRLSISMLCQGLDRAAVDAVWKPFLSWLTERPAEYRLQGEPTVIVLPGRRLWDPAFLRSVPGIVVGDDRPGARPENIFWATNLGEAAQVLHAYESMWLPASLIDPRQQGRLAEALIAASEQWGLTLHTNKALAGGSRDAIAATRDTATNPQVLDAFALVICAADSPPAWPGIPGHEPDATAAGREAAQVTKAMAPMRVLAPDA
ncbi:MAG TPA: FAD-binding oxidoreductase, partial [Luteitalea sp.]|nr:FAD-binding oxidoreductase [Luteitalea sp.]